MTPLPIDASTLPELPGELCTLRPLRLSDVSVAYVNWLNDPTIQRYLESRFVEHTKDSVRSFVAEQLASGRVWFYGIWARPQAFAPLRHIGNIKLGPRDPHHQTADLGFLIGDAQFWGRGIASEAIRLMCGLGQRSGLAKITAGAYANNLGSARALEKAGFVREGKRLSQVRFENGRVDVDLFGFVCS